jgi:DNA-directed RNA polymerase specialized sigma24 family protein
MNEPDHMRAIVTGDDFDSVLDLRDAMETLKRVNGRRARALELHCLEELTLEETADRLRVGVTAVRIELVHAMRFLREKLCGRTNPIHGHGGLWRKIGMLARKHRCDSRRAVCKGATNG